MLRPSTLNKLNSLNSESNFPNIPEFFRRARGLLVLGFGHDQAFGWGFDWDLIQNWCFSELSLWILKLHILCKTWWQSYVKEARKGKTLQNFDGRKEEYGNFHHFKTKYIENYVTKVISNLFEALGKTIHTKFLSP